MFLFSKGKIHCSYSGLNSIQCIPYINLAYHFISVGVKKLVESLQNLFL